MITLLVVGYLTGVQVIRVLGIAAVAIGGRSHWFRDPERAGCR